MNVGSTCTRASTRCTYIKKNLLKHVHCKKIMHSSQNMSEPEDENPEREIEDIAGLEAPLDSEDDASQTDELTDFETALVSGMRVARSNSRTRRGLSSRTRS